MSEEMKDIAVPKDVEIPVQELSPDSPDAEVDLSNSLSIDEGRESEEPKSPEMPNEVITIEKQVEEMKDLEVPKDVAIPSPVPVEELSPDSPDLEVDLSNRNVEMDDLSIDERRRSEEPKSPEIPNEAIAITIEKDLEVPKDEAIPVEELSPDSPDLEVDLSNRNVEMDALSIDERSEEPKFPEISNDLEVPKDEAIPSPVPVEELSPDSPDAEVDLSSSPNRNVEMDSLSLDDRKGSEEPTSSEMPNEVIPIEKQDEEMEDLEVPKDVAIPSPVPVEELSPDSPDAEVDLSNRNVEMDSLSLDESRGSEEPKSPEMPNGTPISLDESQSHASPPYISHKEENVPKAKVPEVEIEEEDLEDGEIMDEEEDDKDDVAADDDDEVQLVNPPSPPPSRVSSKDKDKSRHKEKTASPDKKKKDKEDNINDDLDPVKRLLAEVREKDKSAKEKERERRRKEKKRSKKDEKEKESSSSKKKKRKMSEEEEDGEEFLLVRGASPSTEVESWGDEYGHVGDDRRNKRRRESEESGSSPHNRHNNNRNRPVTEGNASPARVRPIPERPKPARPERREPKSDVICAYFMQGKCQKSADVCNFSHDAVPPRKMELCKFWMMECCAKKEKCLYLHNDFPCKFFHTGLVCRMGDRCKFSHQPLSEVTKQVLLKHIETAPKEILGDFPRLSRDGALNLIHKMEAKLNGLPYHEEDPGEFENHMNHGAPPHLDRHGPPERHGPPPERHGHHGHDRSRGGDNRGHNFGPPNHNHNANHHDNNSGRGRGNIRGGGGGDRGGPDGNNRGDRRQSRWEQTQPTKDDQEKLQELMNEAGIQGFYKDTMEQSGPPQMQGIPNNQQQQQQMFPPQMQNMQPPLLPLLPQFLPHMLPQSQGLPQVNNPALASVLATLNIPSSTIVPPNIPQFQPPPTINTPHHQAPSQSQQQEESNPTQETPSSSSSSENNNSIPDNLPKMQRELFLRIQQQQLKNENKVQTQEKPEPEEQEENWYSDDEEEDSKKKEELKAEINDQISSVLNQIRQQSQQQQQTIPKETEGLKTFFGDTDLRSTPTTDFKDVDLRTNNIFKKINIVPATEINASLSSHGPIIYKVHLVAGLREKPDYSQVRQALTAQAILLDPRLGPKRSNSIPAPESPTDQSTDNLSNQPLNIPDGTPVFDPRTSKGGNPLQTNSNNNNNNNNNRIMMDQPPPNSMYPDNRFVGSMPGMNMNDFSNPFNRDPRASQNQVQPPQQSPNSAAAQNLAMAQNFAAAAALMQQQWPNNQPPIDPNLFMLGFPFLAQPPVTTSQSQNPGMDFNNLMGNAGMRLRPPFMQQQQQPPQSQPPSSSWERFSQGQGDLSPPL